MTRYQRAAMAPTLNAIAHIGPDGEVVVTLKDALLEEHNEEAVAIMLGAARQFGWAVEKPTLTAVGEPSKSSKPRPRHAARRGSRRLRLLPLVVVAFFFASAVSVAAVSYQAGLQDDQATDASASLSPLLHKRRRPVVCAIASCRTLIPSLTPDGSGAPALSSPAPRRPKGRGCATDIRRWGLRTWRRCVRPFPSPSPTPWLGGSSPPAPRQRTGSPPPAGDQVTPPPQTPYAPPWTPSLA